MKNDYVIVGINFDLKVHIYTLEGNPNLLTHILLPSPILLTYVCQYHDKILPSTKSNLNALRDYSKIRFKSLNRT